MRRIWYITLCLWGVLAFHGPQLWLMVFLFSPETGTGGVTEALFNALLVFLWGTIHSLLARDFCKKVIARAVGTDFVKLVYVTVAGISQCLLLFLWRPLSGWHWQAEGPLYWILTFLFLASLTAVFVSSLILDYMEALGIRAIIRRMRRQTDRPMVLSVRGPYAYCRHPVYLFTIFFLWLGPAMNWTKLAFSLPATLYVVIGMFLEDRDTARHMGPAYAEYKKHVPILIPRLKPWRPCA
jgi:protein-S-isoprenylcysteine O-methyltransferase Ste14